MTPERVSMCFLLPQCSWATSCFTTGCLAWLQSCALAPIVKDLMHCPHPLQGWGTHSLSYWKDCLLMATDKSHPQNCPLLLSAISAKVMLPPWCGLPWDSSKRPSPWGQAQLLPNPTSLTPSWIVLSRALCSECPAEKSQSERQFSGTSHRPSWIPFLPTWFNQFLLLIVEHCYEIL